MARRRLLLALLLAAGLGAASPGRAQRPAGAVLTGRVIVDSTRQPIPGAKVEIPSLGASTTTDSLGRFRLTGIPAGRRGIRVDRLGYAPLRTALEFSSADTVEIEVDLSPSSERLDAVEVVASRRGRTYAVAEFERRRATGTGEYLTADDIDRLSRGRLSNALLTLRGISMITGNGGGVYLVGSRASGRSQGTCFTAVMLDGSWVYDGDRWQTPFNINSLLPNEVVAVEYYRGLSNTPVELQGTRNSCGVVALWTSH